MRKLIQPFAKAVTWKMVGAVDTAVIAYFVTGNLGVVESLIGFGLVTHTVLYIAHERVWAMESVSRVFGKQAH